MNSLVDFTNEDLELELKRRKEEDKKFLIPQPRSVEEITEDIPRLIKNLCSYRNDIINGEDREDDDHYLYEYIVELVFGNEFWKWYNSRE